MQDFARRLIAWQRTHGRHGLPWQGTRDAYRIWLSEIMLQQTQVATVIPYYERFLARFPDVRSLAEAPVESVMELWSGLGYYARARNLHRCARAVVERHGGAFPTDAGGIAALPGIGRSTAAAIAAFAFGRRAAILDGNVKRVLARAFGVEGFPGDKAVEGRLWQLAESLLPPAEVETYTQALMDLGAMVCTRSRPACGACPLAACCVALAEGRVAALPAPRPARAVPRRSARYLVLRHGNAVLLERRPPSGIWGGLLCLPELAPDADPQAVAAGRYGCAVAHWQPLPSLAHAFTHFRLTLEPLLGELPRRPQAATEPGLQWLPLEALAEGALPTPIRRILQRLPHHR